MKHTLKLISFGVICAGLVLAQRTPPSPATMVQREVQHLTQSLTLNSSQQAQATTIFTNEGTANQTVMSSLRQARTSLSAAVKTNDTNAIATLSNQIGALTGQMTAAHATASAAFYAILTPDQQAKYNPNSMFGGRGFGREGSRRGPSGAQQ